MLDLLVARKERLLFRADRVDVPGLGQGRQPDVQLTGPLEQLVDEEPCPAFTLLPDELVEGIEPLLGLGRIDVRELVLEFVEGHRCLGSCG